MGFSIIIPAWNLWETTLACLRSLAACHDGMDDLLTEVVVLDNGSSDATATELGAAGTALFGGRFTRVRLEENRGFAVGCNAGALAARGDTLLFLNNDTTVTPHWLRPLHKALQMEDTGAAGPLLLYPDGRNQHCGIFFSLFGNPGHLYARFPGTHPALRQPHPLQAITGACLAVRRVDFETCGGFHEGYRNGYEDMDLCFTLRRRNQRLRVVPESVVIHHEGRTPGRKAHNDANADLFASRWGDAARPDIHRLASMDGYTACLNAQLVTYLRPCDERLRELAATPDREEALRNALEKEPLWLRGRLRLAALQEERGQQAAALESLGEAVSFFPVPEAQRALLTCARRQGNTALAEAALNMLRDAPEAARERSRRVRQARVMAERHGDHLLTGILDGWLHSQGGVAR